MKHMNVIGNYITPNVYIYIFSVYEYIYYLQEATFSLPCLHSIEQRQGAYVALLQGGFGMQNAMALFLME